MAAEPAVRFLHRRIHLPRSVSAGIGVSLTFAILLLVLMTLGALAVRELGNLAGILPEAQAMVQKGLISLEDWLLALAQKAPEGISSILVKTVLEFFSGGNALLSRVTDVVLGLATGVISRIPDGALGFGTGVISSFMISAKLPKIRSFLCQRIPDSWRSRYWPALQAVKSSVCSWLLAQLKLSGITLSIVTSGLFLLKIHFAPLWGVLIAAVDAVPLLGTGTVMLPWALICLLQGQRVRCLGLLGIYVLAAVSRSVLEPRLVGRQMGMDPLLTLTALYLGYRFWGILGMLLSPLAAATAISLAEMQNKSDP